MPNNNPLAMKVSAAGRAASLISLDGWSEAYFVGNGQKHRYDAVEVPFVGGVNRNGPTNRYEPSLVLRRPGFNRDSSFSISTGQGRVPNHRRTAPRAADWQQFLLELPEIADNALSGIRERGDEPMFRNALAACLEPDQLAFVWPTSTPKPAELTPLPNESDLSGMMKIAGIDFFG